MHKDATIRDTRCKIQDTRHKDALLSLLCSILSLLSLLSPLVSALLFVVSSSVPASFVPVHQHSGTPAHFDLSIGISTVVHVCCTYVERCTICYSTTWKQGHQYSTSTSEMKCALLCVYLYIVGRQTKKQNQKLHIFSFTLRLTLRAYEASEPCLSVLVHRRGRGGGWREKSTRARKKKIMMQA